MTAACARKWVSLSSILCNSYNRGGKDGGFKGVGAGGGAAGSLKNREERGGWRG